MICTKLNLMIYSFCGNSTLLFLIHTLFFDWPYAYSSFKSDVVLRSNICHHTTSTQKLFCLHVFRQAGPTQRADCLTSRWEIALGVFPKDTASRV